MTAFDEVIRQYLQLNPPSFVISKINEIARMVARDFCKENKIDSANLLFSLANKLDDVSLNQKEFEEKYHSKIDSFDWDRPF